jgi:ribosomal protein S18 acetylase RimI-like enzyme
LGIPEIQIVEVALKDLRLLQEIAKRTFYDSFAAMNTPENMQLYMDEYLTDEKLEAEILNPDSRFFFANNENSPVGFIKINQGGAQTVLPNDQAFEIERIYVDQPFKGEGIGRLLISKAVELANASGAGYLWLGVWEYNTPAIRFYEKNGFKQFSKHIFKLGNDEQTDLLLKRGL